MSDIRSKRGKEIFHYKASNADPEIPRISKEPIFEAWQFFSIVVSEINYCGYCDEENWLDEFDKLPEFYYKQYEETHKKLEDSIILKDKTMFQFHRWEYSSSRDVLVKGVSYRGWVDEYNRTIGRQMK
jgi:hypothetical protein